MKNKMIIVMAIGLVTTSCKKEDLSAMSDSELKHFVESHINKGDSREKIELFLKAQGWPYSYNQFESRYEVRYEQGRVDKWYMKSAVGPRLYLDNDGRLMRVEIVRLATGF